MKNISEMKDASGKYERITDILKKAEPVLTGGEIIEEKVMERIRDKRKAADRNGFLDTLFGWVYVGWVRSGLVAASIIIISVFVVQQSILLKRINTLERQAITTTPAFVKGTPDDLESTLMFYRQSGKINLNESNLSHRQRKKLEKLINDVQTSSSNLIKLIEDDPEVKKYVEDDPEVKKYVESKLTENDKKKFNL